MAVLNTSPRTDAGQPRPKRSVVLLHGDYDIANVPALSSLLAEAIAHDEMDLVVDLGDVRFLDASTIRALLTSRDALRLQSRSLTVRTSGRTARLLVLLGLGDMLEPGSLPGTPSRTNPAERQSDAS
jgi:anti-anti-sigma factor